jgi:hypothetical protein
MCCLPGARRKKSPAAAGLFLWSERQMMWVTMSTITTTSGTPNNHKMTGIVASVEWSDPSGS